MLISDVFEHSVRSKQKIPRKIQRAHAIDLPTRSSLPIWTGILHNYNVHYIIIKIFFSYTCNKVFLFLLDRGDARPTTASGTGQLHPARAYITTTIFPVKVTNISTPPPHCRATATRRRARSSP